MRVLCTGASGFMGEHLVKKLLEQGNEVVALARNEGRLVRLKEKFPAIKIVIGDICDPFDVEKALAGVDGIYHLAALKSVTLAEDNVAKCIEVNINGTKTVLNATLHYKPKFIIGISTDKAVTRTGVYGCTKFLMERLFDEYRSVNPDTKYQIVRLGNIWGSTGSIGVKWPEKIKRGESIEVSDLKATRFWQTIDETIDGILGIADEPLAVFYPRAAPLQVVLDAFQKVYGLVRWREVWLKKGENLHEKLEEHLFSNEVKQYSVDEFIEKFLK